MAFQKIQISIIAGNKLINYLVISLDDYSYVSLQTIFSKYCSDIHYLSNVLIKAVFRDKQHMRVANISYSKIIPTGNNMSSIDWSIDKFIKNNLNSNELSKLKYEENSIHQAVIELNLASRYLPWNGKVSRNKIEFVVFYNNKNYKYNFNVDFDNKICMLNSGSSEEYLDNLMTIDFDNPSEIIDVLLNDLKPNQWD